MPCYLARPSGDAPRPAVIVFQEIFGVNNEVKRITDLFASAGYAGLALNYYYRTNPALNEPYTQEGLERGFAAAGAVTTANLRKDVAAAVAWLNAQPFVQHGKIATCGFCFGGSVAFLTASVPGIAGAICFYGGSIAAPLPSGEPEALAGAAGIEVPLLLFFGGKDEYITPDRVRRIDETLKAKGKSYEIISYPNVAHAFFRESSAALNQSEVKDAWDRVKNFLEANLSG
jgi:carboxymethylenebutenolidase